MVKWYKQLLAILKPVPEAGSEICSVWRKLLAAPYVRLWLYNKDFDEFDLLALSGDPQFEPVFRRQINQFPRKSIAGSAFDARAVVKIPKASEHPQCFPDPSGTEFFKRLPALVAVPLVSLEDEQNGSSSGDPLGILDIHFESFDAKSLPDDDELLFLGSLSANTLARGHSLERRTTFTQLIDIALDLVVPGSDKTFAARKKTYYSGLLNIVCKSAHANCASIFIAKPGNDVIRCVATTGLQGVTDLEKTKVVYRKADGATWGVFENIQHINSKNVQRDSNVPEYKGKWKETRKICPTNDSDPFLAVPMRGQNGKIATGVIRVLERTCLATSAQLQNFSQYDVDILGSIAAQVSPVFRLLGLHEQRHKYNARLAHQIIQPLTGMLSYSSNLLDGTYKGEVELAKQKLLYIRAMSRGAARLALGSEWVSMNRDFSFLRTHPRSKRSLRQYIIERILDMVPIREHEGIKITPPKVEDLDRLGSFWCDAMYFDQVVQNVLHNAVKYSYPGTEIEVNIARDGKNLVIDVSSTGIPILETEKGLIFSDEERGKWADFLDPEGTGQGLCICRLIMNGFGGKILLVSSLPTLKAVHVPKDFPPAQVNTFRIILPEAFK